MHSIYVHHMEICLWHWHIGCNAHKSQQCIAMNNKCTLRWDKTFKWLNEEVCIKIGDGVWRMPWRAERMGWEGAFGRRGGFYSSCIRVSAVNIFFHFLACPTFWQADMTCPLQAVPLLCWHYDKSRDAVLQLVRKAVYGLAVGVQLKGVSWCLNAGGTLLRHRPPDNRDWNVAGSKVTQEH